MKVIRNIVFETNSSMSHSCVIMTKEQNDLWREGLYYYQPYWSSAFDKLPKDERPVADQFYTKDEIINFANQTKYQYNENDEYDFDEFAADLDFLSYEHFVEDEYAEYDWNTYTTPGGETIVIHCKYGRDG